MSQDSWHLAALRAVTEYNVCFHVMHLCFQWFAEGLGAAAVTAETFIAVPQIWRNYQRKTSEGVSVLMIIGWLAGDLCKGVRSASFTITSHAGTSIPYMAASKTHSTLKFRLISWLLTGNFLSLFR